MNTYQALLRTWIVCVLMAVACALPAQAARAPKPPSTSTATKVLLLLHGMNSSPTTWNDFVASQFSSSANKGLLYGGVLVNTAPTPNSRGVYCYAVEFGAYDKSKGRTGLEGVTADVSTLPTAGDFSDFETLAAEVREAIAYLRGTHSGAQITLLAHSRGGIAARELLQDTAAAERASVIALLTTGAPHKGSRLGRIYSYLEANPRNSGTANDWSIVDKLITQFSFDVRRPVIQDFADDGGAVPKLNSEVANMPGTLKYGNLRYTATDLGYLGRSWGISYSVFQGVNLWPFVYIPPLSPAGREHILGMGNSPSHYKGDGTVEGGSQNLLDLAGRPNFARTYDAAITRSVYHTEETAQITDMVSGLKYLTGWWK